MAKKKHKKNIEINPGVVLAGTWNVTMATGGTTTVNANQCSVTAGTLVFADQGNLIIYAVPPHAYTSVQKV